MLGPFLRRRRLRAAFAAIAAAMLLAACGGSDETAAAIPTPEPNVSGLVPEPSASAAPGPSPGAVSSEPAAPAAVAPTAADAAAVLSCLSTRQRIAQLLLPLATQPELAGGRALAAAGDLGGIGLLGSPNADLAAELDGLQQSTKFVRLMIASDEEGGSVQRLAALLGPLPSAATSASSTPETVQREWLEYGTRVKTLGVDVIFGPVLDVGGGPGIESRSFGDDPAVVSAFGRAVATGLLDAGIMPVFKHFPGHGRATADSHLELPTTPSLDQMRLSDLVPYVELLSEDRLRNSVAVMVGHLSVPGLSDETPTSLSPRTITELLRGELGFEGLVFTDAINMGAIVDSYGTLDAIELALRAGADVIILGSLADVSPALDHLVARAQADPAFAAIVDDRAAHVLAVKGESTACAGAQ